MLPKVASMVAVINTEGSERVCLSAKSSGECLVCESEWLGQDKLEEIFATRVMMICRELTFD